MKKILTASAVFISLSIGAIAHDGVENQAVADRMAAMKAIGGSMKTLGDMAKGATEFDAAAAQAAVDTLEAQSGALPALFEAQETDPESEAKPEIWTNWDDFVSKANSLNAAAAAITITDASSVGPALGAVGGSCKDCHSEYRM
ncbi:MULTISPECIES: c-type cytochrome [Pacificibacter]|uniref:c-type cytochrome n=1 Tax=Pacificibacter TaxID=1042323 RepID=UPI001C0A4997|nr:MULTISPECIES: cytochrome c [Pacificibacter]MBU2937269.1 cytochrome c [Pacificibacter marinus]MDO6615264.1 cytochrome c [Pacificibacter sp. 1_MG-2023]